MKRLDVSKISAPARRLLSTAVRLFAEKGFAGISVREITRVARVTRPVLYYHFGNKKGLYLAAARKAAHDYEAALGNATASIGTTRDRIRRVCLAHAASARERALLATAAGAATRPGTARVVSIVRALVAAGIAGGEFAACDPEDAALAIVGVTEASAAHRSRGGAGSRADDRLAGVLAVVLRCRRPRSVRSRSGATVHRGRP